MTNDGKWFWSNRFSLFFYIRADLFWFWSLYNSYLGFSPYTRFWTFLLKYSLPEISTDSDQSTLWGFFVLAWLELYLPTLHDLWYLCSVKSPETYTLDLLDLVDSCPALTQHGPSSRTYKNLHADFSVSPCAPSLFSRTLLHNFQSLQQPKL